MCPDAAFSEALGCCSARHTRTGISRSSGPCGLEEKQCLGERQGFPSLSREGGGPREEPGLLVNAEGRSKRVGSAGPLGENEEGDRGSCLPTDTSGDARLSAGY